jgi:hypothetical protein
VLVLDPHGAGVGMAATRLRCTTRPSLEREGEGGGSHGAPASLFSLDRLCSASETSRGDELLVRRRVVSKREVSTPLAGLLCVSGR